jgi:hypothetical protein
MSCRLRGLALLLGILSIAAPAGAEWLYFRDGSAIEIKGPWAVQGRQVRFTTRSEVLQSVRLSEVDIAVSEKLSRGATRDRGLYELRSSPDGGRSARTSITEIPLDQEFSLVIVEFDPGTKGNSGRPKCVAAMAYAVTDRGDVVVQLGTAIETVELIGLTTIAAPLLRELVEGQSVCLVQKELEPGRDARGRYRAYAWLRDGREVAIELLNSGGARCSEEKHPRAAQFRRAAEGGPPS